MAAILCILVPALLLTSCLTTGSNMSVEVLHQVKLPLNFSIGKISLIDANGIDISDKNYGEMIANIALSCGFLPSEGDQAPYHIVFDIEENKYIKDVTPMYSVLSVVMLYDENSQLMARVVRTDETTVPLDSHGYLYGTFRSLLKGLKNEL